MSTTTLSTPAQEAIDRMTPGERAVHFWRKLPKRERTYKKLSEMIDEEAHNWADEL